MAIRWDKFTVKAQEAVQRANELASEHGNPELDRCICWPRWLKTKKASFRRCWRKSALGRRPCSADIYKEIEKAAESFWQRSAAGAHVVADQPVLEKSFKEADKFKDEYVSTEHMLLAFDRSEARSGAGDSWRATARLTTPF